MVEVKVTITCLQTVVGAKQHMLPVEYFHSTKTFCVIQISWRLLDCHKVEVNLATISFLDAIRFKILVSVINSFAANIARSWVYVLEEERCT